MRARPRFFLTSAAAVVAALGVATGGGMPQARASTTATPIERVVVIFQENVSFDHYFGTYPRAQNNSGETPFKAKGNTPKRINNLLTPLDVTNDFRRLRNVDLIHNNPNANPNAPVDGPPFNDGKASNPIRLSPAQALTRVRHRTTRITVTQRS